MLYNYHTHTPRCNHARGSEEEYVQSAIDGGYKILGFSDHSPMPFPGGYHSVCRMTVGQTVEYFSTLTALKEKYRDEITIYRGVEAEYFPELFPSLMDILSAQPIDYMILGQHFLRNEYDNDRYVGEASSDPQHLITYVDRITAALSTGCFTYLAHPDVINFTGSDELWLREMTRLCLVCKELNVPLEINLLGLYDHRHYPSDRFFRLAGEIGNDAVIGVDAHDPRRLAETRTADEAVRLAEKYGLHLLDEVPLRDPHKGKWRTD